MVDALRTIAERDDIELIPFMGICVPCCIEIDPLFLGCVSTFAEESPSHKTPSSMLLVVGPEWANDDVSYAFSNLAIGDVHPDNRDPVLKPWNKTNERACGSGIEHPRRLFPRAEWDPLVEMGDKDAVPHCSSMQASSTVQGAWHQTVVASRATGRLLTRR